MRYLYLLFFLFLSLHSYLVFAQTPVCDMNNRAQSTCETIVASQLTSMPTSYSYCQASTVIAGLYNVCRVPKCPEPFLNDPADPTECICPSGQVEYTIDIISGQRTCGPICTEPEVANIVEGVVSCGLPPDAGTGEECVPLMPCDNECPAGQTKQGTINDAAICVGSCSDPNTSWGVVNGVEGCHGPGTDPTCPNGGAYGYVNGVPGCYGGGASDGSGDGSGGAGGSSGSGSGSGGDGSGGAGGSSGSGSGSGGDGGGGSPGGGGSGSGSNNDMGSSYDEAEACPVGMIKSGNKCVSDGRGDCIVGYHELVISRDPYLFICVADDPPPSSSSPSASSQASSSPSSQSASAASASAASGGATGSSGSGSGGGGGGAGDGDSGAGDCDPTAADYFKCSGMLEELSGDDLESMNQSIDDTNTKSLQDYEKLLKDDLDDFEREGVSFADEPSVLKNLLQSFLPVSSACNPPAFNILGRSHTLDCTYFDAFKAAFGWFLAVLTAFQIWQLAIRPVER